MNFHKSNSSVYKSNLGFYKSNLGVYKSNFDAVISLIKEGMVFV